MISISDLLLKYHTLNFALLYETILVITVWHAEPDWSFTGMEYITIIKLYCSYLNTDLDCQEVAWVFESESLLTCRSCQCIWGYVSSTYVCAPISVMHKVVFVQYLWKPLSLPLHFGFIFSLSPKRIYALKVFSFFLTREMHCKVCRLVMIWFDVFQSVTRRSVALTTCSSLFYKYYFIICT